MKRLRMAFVDVIYVQVARDNMRIRNATKKTEVSLKPESPFSTSRLLIGEFDSAESLLAHGIKLLHKGLLPPSPIVIVHPLELIDGGISKVEMRAFIDMGDGAGASMTTVWTGSALSDEEAIRLAEGM